MVGIQHQHHRRRLRTVIDQLVSDADMHGSISIRADNEGADEWPEGTVTPPPRISPHRARLIDDGSGISVALLDTMPRTPSRVLICTC